MENLKFNIPNYVDQNWEEQARKAEGLERLLLANLSRASYQIKEIEDLTITPERLGWMLLWINTFSLSKNAYLAWKVNSEYLIRILSRIENEFSLITHTIFEPIVYQFKRYRKEGNITPPKIDQEREWERTIDRVVSYLAFCIDKDIDILKDFVNPNNLDGIFDPNTGQEIRHDADKLEFHKKFYGKFDLETDEKKLNEEKKEFEAEVKRRLEFVTNISSHPKIKKWQAEINELKQGKNKPLNFFEIFNPQMTSVWQKFKQYNLSYGYLGYQMGSTQIHSSTFEQQFVYFDNNLAPYTHPVGDSMDAKAKSIFDGCTNILIQLELLRNRLWSITNDQ